MTPRFGRVLLFATAFLVYVTDRLAKLIAVKLLSTGQSVKVLPGIFHITLVFNDGAAFGLLRDRAALFVAISAFVITMIILFAWRHRGLPVMLSAALGLILGGSLGNLVDRITFGYVIDFFDFRIWPVFNVADSAISIGVIILAFNLICIRSS